MLALLVEGMQRTHHLMGAAHFTDKTHPNPIPEPERLPRPGEWFRPPKDDAEDEDGG